MFDPLCTIITRAAFLLGYLTYFVGHLVFGLIVVPAYLLLAPFRGVRRRFIKRVFGGYVFFLSRRYLPLLGVYRIRELSGLQQAQAAGPAMYVANHRSRMDGPLMLATVGRATVIIKADYGRSVLYSNFVKYLDFISVDPGALSTLAGAMDKAKRLLANGTSIIVFPEGTRAPTGRLLPFKDIAFRLARATGVPVVPVVLHSDLPFMARRPGSIFAARTISFTIRFLEPQRIGPEQDLAAFVHAVERRIARELSLLDKGTVWEAAGSRESTSGERR